jgi:hypothetical protein
MTHSKDNLPNQTLTLREYSDLNDIPILDYDSDHENGGLSLT